MANRPRPATSQPHRLRQEAATAATKEMGEKLAKALGIKIGDEPPSVDVLQASIAERDAQIVTMQVDAELGTAIAAAGANAATLIPYLRGTKALDGLDPAKKDFAETVTALVATTVEAHPQFKTGAPAAPKSGPTTFPPGGGEVTQLDPSVISGMTDEQFATAMKDGSFNKALGRS